MVVTMGQQYTVGEKPTVILYTYINRHAGTPEKKTGLPKKRERILKWERTATVLYVFKSELVDFEGTFGGYLYNYSFVRHVQIVASAC